MSNNTKILLSVFLGNSKKILQNLLVNKNGLNFIIISKEKVQIEVPLISNGVINLDFYFNPATFLNNWKFCFNTNFPTNVDSNLTILPITITNDLSSISVDATIKNFFSFEYNIFRQLTCIFFQNFEIKLQECACIPKTYSQLVLFRSGVGINCYDIDCAQAIKTNQRAFDGIFCSSSCTQQVCVQAILLNILSGGNTNLNINAQQECNTIINTITNTSNTSNI